MRGRFVAGLHEFFQATSSTKKLFRSLSKSLAPLAKNSGVRVGVGSAWAWGTLHSGCSGCARRPPSQPVLDIAQVEFVDPSWTCRTCAGGTAYLDAADNVLRCAMCDVPVSQAEKGTAPTITEGQPGLHHLGDGCIVEYYPEAFTTQEQHELFPALFQEVPWQQHLDGLTDGRVTTQPRLIAYQAVHPTQSRMIYSYPGLLQPLVPTALTPAVTTVLSRVQGLVDRSTGQTALLDSAHLNLYRTGGDHLSWHTDHDSVFYGDAPVIASVSFGAARDFVLRRADDHSVWLRFHLQPGSLLIMRGTTQLFWEHCVPKGTVPDARINLTFRTVTKTETE